MDDKKSITWGDLRGDAVQALFSSWVRGVIRKCFLTFLPVILFVGGAFVTISTSFLKDMKEELRSISLTLNNVANVQSSNSTYIRQIDARVNNLEKVRDK